MIKKVWVQVAKMRFYCISFHVEKITDISFVQPIREMKIDFNG